MDDREAARPLLAGDLEGCQPPAAADHLCGLRCPPGQLTPGDKAWNPQYVGLWVGGAGALGPPQTRPGPSLVPSRARKTLTVDICARRATWAAFALRPQIPRSPMSPGATVPIPADPVTLGKGLSQWREDRSSFQTPVTSQVPEAPPTGTWLQATLPKCRADGLCKCPAGSQTRNRPRAGQSVGAWPRLEPALGPRLCSEPRGPRQPAGCLEAQSCPLPGALKQLLPNPPRTGAAPEDQAGTGGMASSFSKSFP